MFFYYFSGIHSRIEIGETIKKFRELKNITRESMAQEMDMSLSGYSKIERNEIDLTLNRAKKIADILGVDLSQLLNFDSSQIFNLSNNNTVQAAGAKAEQMHFYSDHYKDKYISMLEQENERLKKDLQKK